MQKMTETFAVVCHAPFQYMDGQCAKPITANDSVSADALINSSFPIRDALNNSGVTTGSTTVSKNAMMGFTFAPPEIKWGYDYEEDACIDLIFTSFCFTVFAAHIGYDFELGVGLRLPVQLDIDGVPSPEILAQSQAILKPKLTPVDFSAADYKQFCQNNNMADGVIIADCDTFSFPEFLSSELDKIFPGAVKIDGKELVAQTKIFAGIQVIVMDVPIIDIGVDAGSDFATDCTFLMLKDGKLVGDLLNFGADIASGLSLLDTIKQQNLNCSSFTTPFGSAPSALDGSLQPLTFPFIKTFHLDADCIKATTEGQVITVGGKVKPICTGLEIKYDGASLGLGLDVLLSAGSSLITADWSTSGDAGGPGDTLQFQAPPFSAIVNPDLGPVTFDNFDNSTDTGTVSLNHFTYYLDTLTIGLNANVEFGGILSFLPDIGSLPIFELSIDTGTLGIPLPQHNGTGPVNLPVFVANYALGINGSPSPSNDPKLIVNNKTLKIQPGQTGTFNIQVTNLGSVKGDFNNFGAVLPDTLAQFNLPQGWTTNSDLGTETVNNVDAHSTASQVATMSVSPLRHPLTRPGIYPVTITADSVQAKSDGINAQDPSGQFRIGAPDVINVQIVPFYDPRITVTPGTDAGKPGSPGQNYGVQGQNFGNVADTELLSHNFADFNPAGCTLTTLGSSSGCPFRAVPTVIQETSWTTIAALAISFGPLDPLGLANGSFGIAIPPDWAGMQDTTYTFTLTATSSVDPALPPAHNTVTQHQTVVATKQSMTRYVGLELADLVLQIQNANAAGFATGGSLPIIIHDVQPKHANALASIVSGSLAGANGNLATEIKGMGAFLHAVNGPGSIPVSLVSDWVARANAIITDMTAAQASNVTSQ